MTLGGIFPFGEISEFSGGVGKMIGLSSDTRMTTTIFLTSLLISGVEVGSSLIEGDCG